MPTRVLRPGERAYLDTDSRAMIFHGCSTKQLGEIFGLKEPDVMRKLAGINAVGSGKQGNPLYRIRDAAPLLVKIPITPEMIEHYMVSSNPKNLPPATNAMFWQGMMTRRNYEEKTGDLWHTSDVSQVASDAFQSLRMSLLLIPDNISEKTELNEEQRRMVQAIVDSALEEARERLISDLRKPGGRGPRPSSEEGDL